MISEPPTRLPGELPLLEWWEGGQEREDEVEVSGAGHIDPRKPRRKALLYSQGNP